MYNSLYALTGLWLLHVSQSLQLPGDLFVLHVVPVSVVDNLLGQRLELLQAWVCCQRLRMCLAGVGREVDSVELVIHEEQLLVSVPDGRRRGAELFAVGCVTSTHMGPRRRGHPMESFRQFSVQHQVIHVKRAQRLGNCYRLGSTPNDQGNAHHLFVNIVSVVQQSVFAQELSVIRDDNEPAPRGAPTVLLQKADGPTEVLVGSEHRIVVGIVDFLEKGGALLGGHPIREERLPLAVGVGPIVLDSWPWRHPFDLLGDLRPRLMRIGDVEKQEQWFLPIHPGHQLFESRHESVGEQTAPFPGYVERGETSHQPHRFADHRVGREGHCVVALPGHFLGQRSNLLLEPAGAYPFLQGVVLYVSYDGVSPVLLCLKA